MISFFIFLNINFTLFSEIILYSTSFFSIKCSLYQIPSGITLIFFFLSHIQKANRKIEHPNVKTVYIKFSIFLSVIKTGIPTAANIPTGIKKTFIILIIFIYVLLTKMHISWEFNIFLLLFSIIFNYDSCFGMR